MAITPCEQAVLDLAAYKLARANLLTGKRVIGVRQADKGLDYYAAGNIEALDRLIREKQAEVDACNGVRGRNRGFILEPSGW